MSTWIAVVAVGLGSYVLRAVPLVVLGRVTVSPRLDLAVRRASAAAVAALLVAAVRHGAASGPDAPTLVATAVGLGLALRGASMLRVVAAGAVAYAGGAALVAALG